MVIDIYEHFDIDIEDIGDNCTIRNKLTNQWSISSLDLWEGLILLKRCEWNAIKFREQIHDGKSLELASIYQELLDQWAYVKRILQPLANEFCIRHKGYSLS